MRIPGRRPPAMRDHGVALWTRCHRVPGGGRPAPRHLPAMRRRRGGRWPLGEEFAPRDAAHVLWSSASGANARRRSRSRSKAPIRAGSGACSDTSLADGGDQGPFALGRSGRAASVLHDGTGRSSSRSRRLSHAGGPVERRRDGESPWRGEPSARDRRVTCRARPECTFDDGGAIVRRLQGFDGARRLVACGMDARGTAQDRRGTPQHAGRWLGSSHPSRSTAPLFVGDPPGNGLSVVADRA